MGNTFRQAFGFNSEELGRAERSVTSDEKRNQAALRVAFGFNTDEPKRAARAVDADGQVTMAFGYNAEETKRADRTSAYDVVFQRESFFPLIDWQWTREIAAQYIRDLLGVEWPRSACIACPFNLELSKGTEKGLARLRRHPKKAVEALLIERVSMAMNPRATLFVRHSLHSILEEAPDFAEVLEKYRTDVNGMQWSLYRVRRVYSKKGKADRCVEVLHVGSRAEALEAFAPYRDRAINVETVLSVEYAYVHERGEVYPAFEEYFVCAPATVKTKARYGVPWFDARWDLLYNQQILPATEANSIAA